MYVKKDLCICGKRRIYVCLHRDKDTNRASVSASLSLSHAHTYTSLAAKYPLIIQLFCAKYPLIIRLFCEKWPMKIRHPVRQRERLRQRQRQRQNFCFGVFVSIPNTHIYVSFHIYIRLFWHICQKRPTHMWKETYMCVSLKRQRQR